jgi:hypothetical protein
MGDLHRLRRPHDRRHPFQTPKAVN